MSPLSPSVIALICSKSPSQIICTWGSRFFPKFLLTLPHYSTETACIRYQLFAKLNPAASSPSHLLDGAACDAVDHSVPKLFFHLASKTSHFLDFSPTYLMLPQRFFSLFLFFFTDCWRVPGLPFSFLLSPSVSQHERPSLMLMTPKYIPQLGPLSWGPWCIIQLPI